MEFEPEHVWWGKLTPNAYPSRDEHDWMGNATDTFVFDAVWQRDVPLTPRIFFGMRRYGSDGPCCPRTVPGNNESTVERKSSPRRSQHILFGREVERSAGFLPSSWRNIFAGKPATDGSALKLGVNYVRASHDTTTVNFALGACQKLSSTYDSGESATLTLGQDLRNLGLGAVLWDCGEELAKFLGRRRHLVMGKRVLDLGTGTGIAGLAAATCGARDVTLTDHGALAPLVRSNVERNAPGFAAVGSSPPIFRAFSWDVHTAAEMNELARPDNPFDIVLASDCLYDTAMVAAFRRVLVSTCGPETVVVMAYKRRIDSREQAFFMQLEEEFDLELVGHASDVPTVPSRNLKGDRPKGVTVVGQDRGIYLLLGARCRRSHSKEASSPLDEWRLPEREPAAEGER